LAWGFGDRARRAVRWVEAFAGAEESRLALHQVRGARHLRFPRLAAEDVRWVAGVDAHVRGDVGIGAAVLFEAGSGRPPEIALARRRVRMPYRYGYLGFRELPPILAAMAKLSRRPELAFYDGNGALHPRGFGAASQFGLYLGLPTIGVSKNVSEARSLPGTRGDFEVIEPGRGGFLTTRTGVKPVCVSPGHLIDLESSCWFCLEWSEMRIPEPLRHADQAARRGAAAP
jgi:deoxyribonuclease V